MIPERMPAERRIMSCALPARIPADSKIRATAMHSASVAAKCVAVGYKRTVDKDRSQRRALANAAFSHALKASENDITALAEEGQELADAIRRDLESY